jgi:isoleucyl-tRNA synthetase
MRGEDIRISEDEYRNQVRGLMLILWNSYNYFITYANLDGWKPGEGNKSENILDKWVLSLLNVLITDFTKSLEEYDTPQAISLAKDFVNNFSTWYIRRSRTREDKVNFYETCYRVLTKLSQVLAPVIPFMTEQMYKNLTKEESVHLTSWPEANKQEIDSKILEEMVQARKAVEHAHSLRKEKSIPVRQPLASLATVYPFTTGVQDIIKDEVNVKSVVYNKDLTGVPSEFPSYERTPELIAEGESREIMRQIQDERKKLGTRLDEKVKVFLPSWPKEYEDDIKKRTLVSEILEGEFRVERA